MTRILNLFLLLALSSCAPAKVGALPEPTVEIPVPRSEPVFTSEPSAATVASTETPFPCDPLIADFCITDGHFILQNPIKPPANDALDETYRYGSTADGRRKPHHGVDISNPSGTPVYAAGRGMVVFAGPDKEALYSPWVDFYGNLVVVKHSDDLYTLYAHLSSILVKEGREVFAGEPIGEVGRTGVAIGSHLHFEVRCGGDGRDYFSTLNPELWLIPKNGEKRVPLGALMISVIDSDQHFRYAEFTVRYHLDPNGPRVRSYYGVTYPAEMANDRENAALGGLSPGYYHIAINADGRIHERWVEVESGKLTQVIFIVN